MKGENIVRGVDTVNLKEANIALLSAIPEDAQHEIHKYLSGYCEDNPFKCLSRTDILDELKKSRENYEKGEYKDFDQALNDISKKYDL